MKSSIERDFRKENGMDKTKHLNEIINREESVKKTKESKYFTEEVLNFFEIRKYRSLFEEYKTLYFKERTFCRLGEGRDEEKDSFIWFLTFDDKSVEEGLNVLMDIDELRASELSDDEKGENFDPYFLTNNSITISAFEDASYIYLSKTNKKVLEFYAVNDTWDWKVLANNFDEFIDKLYLVKVEEKEVSEKEKNRISKIVDNILKMIKK